nr:glycosyltransferase [uncultured Rhodoferax sp.]
MVSVLIRSMDRAFLAQALGSVALQTYPNIEVVVLAVRPNHTALDSLCGKFPLRLVVSDETLLRSAAANRAMAAARGEFLIFLDDDDWMMPGHIARLVEVLTRLPQTQAVYTGIGLVDAEGKPMGQTFDLPFDPIRQMAGNLTPIHAVLFRASVLSQGCHFDEALDRLEDWDFWLQIANLAPMVHLPGVSAVYRIHESSGVHNEAGPEGAASRRIYEKWEPYWTQQQIAQIMQRVWSHPEMETRLNALHEQLSLTQQSLAIARQSLEAQQSTITEQNAFIADQASCITEQTGSIEQLQQIGESLSQSLIRTTAELKRSEGIRLAVLNSRFWRMTSPLRWLAIQVKAVFFHPDWGRVMRFPRVLFREGPSGVRRRLQHQQTVGTPSQGDIYRNWARTHDTLPDSSLAQLGSTVSSWSHRPLISIVMPVYNPPLDLLDAAISSIKQQIYPQWELCIADDASTNPEVWLLLQRLALSDKRIKTVRRETNGHISQASNSALALASGEFIALMDNDDILPPDALYWVAEATVRTPDVQVIYSDEDKLDSHGERFDAYFKSDWNYTLFLGHNMISHLGVYRTQLVRDVGGFRLGLEGSQDYDLALRCIERITDSQIIHIPRVLYHWRAIESSTALNIESKPYALDAAQRALQDHLERIGSTAKAERMPSLNYRCVRTTDSPENSLSLVLVHSEGEPPIGNTQTWTADANLNIAEVLCSQDNAQALNTVIASAKGKLVALVRAGLKPTKPAALAELVGYALEARTGAAGGTVRIPSGGLISGGLVLNQANITSTLHLGLPEGNHGYMGRGFLAQELSAVAMDCVVLRKEVFISHGGFDADLGISPIGAAAWCLRLRELGLRVIWCPDAAWLATEDYRPPSTTQIALQRQIFMNRYGGQYANWLLRDPAYHPLLDATAADFSLPD